MLPPVGELAITDGWAGDDARGAAAGTARSFAGDAVSSSAAPGVLSRSVRRGSSSSRSGLSARAIDSAAISLRSTQLRAVSVRLLPEAEVSSALHSVPAASELCWETLPQNCESAAGAGSSPNKSATFWVIVVACGHSMGALQCKPAGGSAAAGHAVALSAAMSSGTLRCGSPSALRAFAVLSACQQSASSQSRHPFDTPPDR